MAVKRTLALNEVFRTDNDLIPRTSRTWSSEGPGDTRRSPRGNEQKALLMAGIPAETGSTRDGRIWLCKPEVTGSIPVRSINSL